MNHRSPSNMHSPGRNSILPCLFTIPHPLPVLNQQTRQLIHLRHKHLPQIRHPRIHTERNRIQTVRPPHKPAVRRPPHLHRPWTPGRILNKSHLRLLVVVQGFPPEYPTSRPIIRREQLQIGTVLLSVMSIHNHNIFDLNSAAKIHHPKTPHPKKLNRQQSTVNNPATSGNQLIIKEIIITSINKNKQSAPPPQKKNTIHHSPIKKKTLPLHRQTSNKKTKRLCLTI